MKTFIKCGRLVTETDIKENALITVTGDKIDNIGGIGGQCGECIDLSGLIVMPGLVDIHVHGGDGVDAMDGGYDVLEKLSAYKLNEGVTSFLPTTVTAPFDEIKAAIANIRETVERGVSGAKIQGSFVEGPYLGYEHRGAHPEEYLREISLSELEELIGIGGGTLNSIIIAPDLEHSLEAIEFLRQRGVVARLGHTSATYERFTEAISKGGTVAVHLFNGMNGFSHRAPGSAGAVLNNDIYAEIICDTIHVDIHAIQVAVKCKGYDRIVLITDCLRAGGLPDGHYSLGVLDVFVKEGQARLKDGTLAGSTMGLNKALSNYHRLVGVPLIEAVKAATINPAKAIGLSGSIGSVAVGKKADIIGVDEDFNVKFVMVDGVVKLNKI